MRNSKTRSRFFLEALSISSSFSACETVRGKPSRMKPFLHSGFTRFSLMRPTRISSDTSWPASMMGLAILPISDPDATAARSMSPEDRAHTLRSLMRFAA